VVAATVLARLREAMVTNSGAAAKNLMNDRRLFTPLRSPCSANMNSPLFLCVNPCLGLPMGRESILPFSSPSHCPSSNES
jgi:hypothetical protein